MVCRRCPVPPDARGAPDRPDPIVPGAQRMKVVLASGNPAKLRELGTLLAPGGLTLVPQSAFGIVPPPETGTTFLDNALLKARHAARVTGLPALADDSGIEVDALGGRPGVYSARFAGEGASDEANLRKLLSDLSGVAPGQRQARYRCVIVLVRRHDDPEPLIARGSWEGAITLAPRGTGGFGYDPVFLPAGSSRTAAEFDAREKNAVSHRGQALRALVVQARAAFGAGFAAHAVPPADSGRLFVVAAPSGAGKTSLVRELLRRVPRLQLSVSHTTRARRPTEAEGREYYFVTVAEFQKMVSEGRFLEHARVFENYYGTAREPVERTLAQGRDVVLEIDWQGARQVRAALPSCLSIFVLPPSREALEQRLRGRATDAAEVIARRLRDAVSDMSHWNEFDYVVVNDDFGHAVADLVRIAAGQGEALAAGRPELAPLLGRLLA